MSETISPTNNDRPRRRATSAALLTAIMLLLIACNRTPERNESASSAPSNTTPGSGAQTTFPQNSYADLVSRVAPAVVTVHSARRVRAPRQHPFLDDPRFREFFGDILPRVPESDAPRQIGLGSGVIVSGEGYVLTNHHVIDGAEEIQVELNDRRTYAARVVGSDPPSDLAVLKVDQSDLPVLAIGDSDRARVGDVVLAIGSPLGLGQTVTAGIISAKSRTTGLSDGSFEDFIQTDAPINQGNSGGALISSAGELIGINSQILSTSGGNIGIGFAIPSNMARYVMDQLIQTGRVRRGSLGVTLRRVTSDVAASLGLQEVRGALVESVIAGSPAERAGVMRGDVVTAFNGTPIADTNSLRNAVAGTQPGTEVTMTVIREGREQQLRATLGELNTDSR
ncbi:MAG TPA: Do family serine endopeptidase [Blastocatellia bacterium]|nr:Do family serine endopeptidase [Blastocatellia bacterium]